MRKLTLEASKKHILNSLYRSRVEADRRILNEELIAVGQSFETAESFALISVASSELELLVFRKAQDLFFSDAKPNDYFALFQKACRINTGLILDGTIAGKKGEVFVMQALLKLSADAVEQIGNSSPPPTLILPRQGGEDCVLIPHVPSPREGRGSG